jgi:hypothetical protein
MDEPVSAALGAHLLVRRVEVRAVDRDPQIFPIPNIDKSIIHTPVLPRVPQALVVVHLHHAGVVQLLHLVVAKLRSIPGRRVRRIHFLKLPKHIDHGATLFLWNDAPNHDKAFGYPMLPIGFAQHAEGQRLLDILQLDGLAPCAWMIAMPIGIRNRRRACVEHLEFVRHVILSQATSSGTFTGSGRPMFACDGAYDKFGSRREHTATA